MFCESKCNLEIVCDRLLHLCGFDEENVHNYYFEMQLAVLNHNFSALSMFFLL